MTMTSCLHLHKCILPCIMLLTCAEISTIASAQQPGEQVVANVTLKSPNNKENPVFAEIGELMTITKKEKDRLLVQTTGGRSGYVRPVVDESDRLEIADLAAGENATTHVETGDIAFTDVDLADGHIVGVAEDGAGYRGTLVAIVSDASTGDGAGTVSWTYSIDDSAIDDLAAGETLVQSYTLTVDDANGG